uniref:Si:ch211-245h14.1 n=1 Tax=Lepisosteus oculatus TaxID=7918 RepID=W5NJC8_LEPOC
EAEIDDTQLLTLTRQDLNELLPGPTNFQIRRKIMDFITASKVVDSEDGITTEKGDVSWTQASNASDTFIKDVLHNYLLVLKDMEVQLRSVLDFLQQHIHQLDRLGQCDPMQLDEKKHRDEKPNKGQLNACHDCNQSQVDPWTPPPNSEIRMHFLSCVFIHKLSQHLTNFAIRVLTKGYENTSGNAVLVFCPVHSRVGADIEEATKKIPTNKNAVLVVMHHTHDPNRVLSESSRLVNRTNIVETVDCLFHETVGLLECEVNTQAIVKVSSALQKYL